MSSVITCDLCGERDARQRDLIRRLAEFASEATDQLMAMGYHDFAERCDDLLAEARGIEATNE